MAEDNETKKMTRRSFLAGTAAAATFTIVKPSLVRGSAANSAVELGLIGCGGRGHWIAQLFQAHKGYKIVAAGDYFRDRVDSFGKRFGVPAGRRYTGLSNHRRLLAGKLDAVAIESPPYFHPEQAAAGVEAGKHVYVAKPIAVDVPGCKTIGEAGKKATAKKRVFLVDFQTRANAFYQEAIKRVHNGDIGRLINGTAFYFCGLLGGTTVPSDPEGQLRKWVLSKVLSGDIITEQNIHALDVACWIADADPISAVGTGGQRVRKGRETTNDHFNLVFEFSRGAPISFASRQCGKGPGGIFCTMYGTRGAVETQYGGNVKVHGDAPYGGGNTGDIFKAGCVSNIATFHKSITEGRCDNPTVAPSVRSNLTTILGRTAAYTGRKVTWAEMMKANAKLPARLAGLKD
jgi:myo-inositol 2-dehydrogenase/D-chiro-inositol 1-dehydrogenase